MKFAVILFLACVSVCYVSSFRTTKGFPPSIRTWGYITPHIIGNEHVIVSKTMLIKHHHKFTFQVIFLKYRFKD